MTWFHGTTSAFDIMPGDRMNPGRGSFEPGVWATSCPKAAAAYAQAAVVVHGGEAEVWEINVYADNIESVDFENAAFNRGSVIIARNGEYNADMLFIGASNVATFGYVIA
jgi:hypothetical protein